MADLTRFLKLTLTETGQPALVNPRHISWMTRHKTGTQIFVRDRAQALAVTESLEEVESNMDSCGVPIS